MDDGKNEFYNLIVYLNKNKIDLTKTLGTYLSDLIKKWNNKNKTIRDYFEIKDIHPNIANYFLISNLYKNVTLQFILSIGTIFQSGRIHFICLVSTTISIWST